MKRETSTIRLFKRAGWVEVRRSRHAIMRCPCGEHQVAVSITASDWRANKNALASGRRCPVAPPGV